MRCWILMVVLGPTTAQLVTGVEITVHATDAILDHFEGVGFHASHPLHWTTKEHFEQVLAKRWRELAPSFARVNHRWAQRRPVQSDRQALEALARHLVFMKENTGTVVYLTTFGMGETEPGEERRRYAQAVANDLEFLLKAGATNLRYYCVTNELSLTAWASLRNDLATFRDYHQEIFAELRKRNLPVLLLATDASPIRYWSTLEWAAEHMDEITGVYGGHHYIESDDPGDLEFYDYFYKQCLWAVQLARSKGKDFILGEFGSRQYHDRRWGIRWDTCLHYGTQREPQAALQVCEAALAAINAGVCAMAYWTFTDYPDEPGLARINQWGVFKWLTNGCETRAPYYAYGLLTKFFRGPATVVRVEVNDALVRASAVRNNETGQWSVAIINRRTSAIPLWLRWNGSAPVRPFRKYVFEVAAPPRTDDGDLQEPLGKVGFAEGVLVDTLPANSLVVYTTAYDEEPPPAVEGLKVEPVAGGRRLSWLPSPATDLCYYRIYHNNLRIGSTITTEFLDTGPTRNQPGRYRVVAVDTSGNAGP